MTEADLRTQLARIQSDVAHILRSVDRAENDRKDMGNKLDETVTRVTRLEENQVPRAEVAANSKQTTVTQTRYEDAQSEEQRKRADAEARREIAGLIWKATGVSATGVGILVSIILYSLGNGG